MRNEQCNDREYHEYAEKECACGAVFCYACCGGTNVDQGGKYDPDYMFCPECGADYYLAKEELEV